MIFKQLTIPQFSKLNNPSSEQSIRRALDKIFRKRKPLVKRVEFKKVAHFGRLSYVYSLSTYGVKKLEDQLKYILDEKTFTPKTPRLSDDYFHRVSTIDFQIYMHSYRKNEDFQILKCNHYFLVRKVINSFNPINKVELIKRQSIIPDLVALLSKDGKERWIMFELHNGIDKRRIKNQIKQHALCLTGLFAHRKYKIESNRYYNILIVFEVETVMKAVIKDISNDIWYNEVAKFFLCKSKKELKDTFLNKWINLSGAEVEIQF